MLLDLTLPCRFCMLLLSLFHLSPLFVQAVTLQLQSFALLFDLCLCVLLCEFYRIIARVLIDRRRIRRLCGRVR